jgi:hypothetical protein
MYRITNLTRECLYVEGKDLLPEKSISVDNITLVTTILADNKSIKVVRVAEKTQLIAPIVTPKLKSRIRDK